MLTHKTHWLLLSCALLLTAGCSRHETADNGASESSGAADPCGLLEVKEVEAVMGPLAGPPYRMGSRGPDAEGSACIYEAKSGRELKLDVTWEGGASLLKMMGMPAAVAEGAGMKGKLPLPDGVTVAGEWDEAKTIGCCQIAALRGDQLVQFDYAATQLTDQQGVDLLNAALKRLDSPLKVDGSAGIKSALARAEQRPKEVPACSLLTQADVEPILGKLLSPPEGSDNSCTYRYTQVGQDGKPRPWAFDFKVSWQGGYRTIREEPAMAAGVMKGLIGGAAGGAAPASESIPGPWEQAAVTSELLAVKKDVLMRADLRLVSRDVAAKLIGKAMEKI